ncbi:SAM-dependent methyltransferase [Candidatus Pacearchaeota archaeon CG10_big_fil_rev_8_21_14_0_10_35_219]|nr:MAG: hypothetical protein AUJ62_00530 [Candidatus Pacearchaeota archaeon CG1_02_32_21]PIO07247.1 MAG: SAM-dependent methyltransferase [Candidatus Pacearchaeota archaeon CG10_big_fil_rev_8_21_14_0_10_35_219]PIY81185.1 MAG: SAM-dependent methyltransferase [Candidatus Pacearchaeota archaeon CG_4_10_14_0_8_um_filter_35_169]PIZ79436.1 MAG: SAM-dependent methyltransferase [Candidatus Pacearchaeota archaeon CG_4_10_14_0_2_um_filter_35_33]PJA70368.1 MAG: SAM-dependent methyltransferase [Candidatus P
MVRCPICNWTGKNFLSFGRPLRNDCKCPKCGSKERQRYFFLFLRNFLPKKKKINVLHVAPEKGIRDLFKSYPNISYLSIDLHPKRFGAMHKEDLTALSFEDGSFDILFCSHVLEHIKNDVAALAELYRVLKKNGTAIVYVPLFNFDKTIEDCDYSPSKRFEIFGQEDHLRAYGKDFSSKLKKAGFNVRKVNFANHLKEKELAEFGLIHHTEGTPLEGCSQEEIYLCSK